MTGAGYVQGIFLLPKERKTFLKNILIKISIKLFAGWQLRMVKN